MTKVINGQTIHLCQDRPTSMERDHIYLNNKTLKRYEGCCTYVVCDDCIFMTTSSTKYLVHYRDGADIPKVREILQLSILKPRKSSCQTTED